MLTLMLTALVALAPQDATPAKAPKAKKAATKVAKKAKVEAPKLPEGVAAILESARAAQKKVHQDLQAWEKEGKARKDFRMDLSKALAELAEKQKAVTDPEEKQALLVSELFLRAKVLLGTPAPELVEAVKKDVAPTAWGWSLEPGLLPWFANRYVKDAPAKLTLLETASEKNLDAEVQVNALFAFWQENFQEVDAVADKAFTRLKKEFPYHFLTRRAVDSVAKDALTTPGKAAPAFSLKALEGEETYTLASFKGKYVLVDFWATWCPYCVAEVPGLHKAFEAFKDKGLEVLSLSCDRKVEDIAPYRAKGNPMPWKHAFLEGGKQHDVAKAYGVTGIPKPVLVGPDGKILAAGTALRGEKLMETLAKHLK